MRAPTVEFWFDYSCPYAYLASTQVEAMAARMNAPLVFRPMLLGGVFRAREVPQNLSATLGPAKAAHNLLDMQRWAELFDVALVMPPEHPMRTVEALRATLATKCDPKVIHGLFRAYWVEGRAPSSRETLRDVLTHAGHDAEHVLELLERSDPNSVREQLRLATEEAISKGIFGAPTFITRDELYWGQDRMHFVEGTAHNKQQEPRAMSESKTLEIFWDFSSPYAYLGSTQAKALAARTGATLVWKPMLLGGVFKQIGQVNVPMQTWSPAKQDATYKDMFRWAEYWSVPFAWPEHFPVNTIKALRCYLALPEERRDAYRENVFEAYWGRGENISDEAVLAKYIGNDAQDIFARTQDNEIKQALIAATQHAVDRGVFGAPTWIVNGTELFWGQDRIPLVERALNPLK